MTDYATIARDNALSLEVKKDGFTQRQDGSVILRLRCHPQEMPDAIMKAPMGTRYVAVLVEIGDDETPTRKAAPEQAAPPVDSSIPAAGKSWREMSPAQQAGVLCNDKTFWRYLTEVRADGFIVRNDEDAAGVIRNECLVNSRAEIIPGTAAANKWRELVRNYRAWIREPEVVG